jgi:AcrR family transcriptional regulator
MIHIMKEKNNYHSPLRQEQMQKTREQILDGLIRTMANGVASLSIPAVAREAGVSVPTVYRYFRTKRDLVEALGGYLIQKAGLSAMQPPGNPEELATAAKELFIKYEGLDELLRAAAMSEYGNELRKETIQWRIGMYDNALAPVSGQFNETDRVRLRNIILILCSTATIRAFKDYLNLSGESAADNVTWAIRTLTRATSQPDGTTRQQ